MPFCRYCGQQNSDEVQFCVSCGATLDSPQPVSPPSAPAYHPPVDPIQQAQDKIQEKAKRSKKVFWSVFIVVIALGVLLGIILTLADTKEFTYEELTMAVPSSLHDASDDFRDHDFVLDSSDLAIFGNKFSFSKNPELESMGELAYLQQLAGNLGEDDSISNLNVEISPYVHMTYTENNSNGRYKHDVAVFKTDDGFWVIELAGPGLSEDTAKEILSSVEFS